MDNRYHTFIATIRDVTGSMVMFELFGPNDKDLKTHVISATSTFTYERLHVGQTYAITSRKDGRTWVWLSAVKCNPTEVVL